MLSLSNALAGSGGRVAPPAESTLVRVRRGKGGMILTDNHPVGNITPLTRRLCLGGCNKFVLSFGNTEVAHYSSGTVVCGGIVPRRIVHPVCRTMGRCPKLSLVSCASGMVLSNVGDGRCARGRTTVGDVRVYPIRSFPTTLSFPIGGVLVPNRPSVLRTLVPGLRGRCRKLLGVCHSRPFFLRVVPRGVSGTRSLRGLLGDVNLATSSVVYYNSNFGSLSVVRCTNLNMTVRGTRPIIGRSTSFVAGSGSRSKVLRIMGLCVES